MTISNVDTKGIISIKELVEREVIYALTPLI